MNQNQRQLRDGSARVLQRLRSVCHRFPHVEEIDEGSVGDPVFKVDGRIFAMQHLVDNRMSLWCKAAPGVQDTLVASAPNRFFVPPYVGHRGWVGVWLDVSLDWDEIDDLIEESYRRTAPARFIPLLDVRPAIPAFDSHQFGHSA